LTPSQFSACSLEDQALMVAHGQAVTQMEAWESQEMERELVSKSTVKTPERDEPEGDLE